MFPWLDDDNVDDNNSAQDAQRRLALKREQFAFLIEKGMSGFNALTLRQKATFLDKSPLNTDNCKDIPDIVKAYVIRERRLARLKIKHNERPSEYLYLPLAEKEAFIQREGFDGFMKKLDVYERAWFLDDASGVYANINMQLKQKLLLEARVCKILLQYPDIRTEYIRMGNAEKRKFLEKEGLAGFKEKLTDFEQSVFLTGLPGRQKIPDIVQLTRAATDARERHNARERLKARHNNRPSEYLYLSAAEKSEFLRRENFRGFKQKLDVYERAFFLENMDKVLENFNLQLKHQLTYESNLCKILVENPGLRTDYVLMGNDEKIDFLKNEGLNGFKEKLTDFEQSVFLNDLVGTFKVNNYDFFTKAAEAATQRFNAAAARFKNNPKRACELPKDINDADEKITTQKRVLKGL